MIYSVKRSLCTAVCAIAITASAAHADTINQVFYDIAMNDGVLNTPAAYLFNDSAVTTLASDVAPVGTMSQGDVLEGTFNFESLSHLGGSSTLIGASSGGSNDALFGRFSIMVTGASLAGGITFAPSGNLGADTMFEVYTASANTVDTTAADGGYSDAAFASADLYASLGFSVAAGGQYSFAVTPSVSDLTFGTLLSAALNGTTIANITGVRLYVTDDGTSDGGESLAGLGSYGLLANSGNVDGSGSIIGTGASRFDATTAFQMNLTVTPEPATIALALIGGVAMISRRRRAA